MGDHAEDAVYGDLYETALEAEPFFEDAVREMADIIAEAVWRGTIDTRNKPWSECHRAPKRLARKKARAALVNALEKLDEHHCGVLVQDIITQLKAINPPEEE